MTQSTTLEHPARVALELGDQQIVFVLVGDNRYAAELDGKRRPIQTTKQESRIYENGDRDPYEPTRSEGDTANIDTILRCLALDATHTPLPHGAEISAKDNWGHFRQNTFLTISITITESRSVEINENIQEQDDSYY